MGIPISYIQIKVSFFGSMQRLAKHRTPMLAGIFIVLVALSSTIMMLITMGQQEETLRQKETNLQDENLQDDHHQLIASTYAKGKAHFGLGILNRIEHQIIEITNNNNATATANGIKNNNNANHNNNNIINNNNANNRNTLSTEENKKNTDDTTYLNQNNFVNSKNSPATRASCGQMVTSDV